MSGKDTVSRLEEMLKDHERRITLLEQQLERKETVSATSVAPVVVIAPTPPPTPVIPQKITVRQLMLEKGPEDDVQRCAVIAYYLEKREEYKSFNAKDIEKGFVDAREKVPGNVSDKILKNVWKGHMMQVPEEKDGLKAYVLTNSGIKFIESGLRQQ
jgi:hypothetical protein